MSDDRPRGVGQHARAFARWGTTRSIGLFAIWAAVLVVPLLSPPLQAATAFAAFAVAALGWRMRDCHATRLALFWAVFVSAAVMTGAGSQLSLALAIVAYLLAPRAAHWLGDGSRWLSVGQWNAPVALAVFATAGVFGLTLFGWFSYLRPEMGDLAAMVPDVPLPLLLAGGVLFACFNAAVEEFAYRGVLMHHLSAGLAAPRLALVLQAVAFGTFHIHGFPRGALGVVLAAIAGLVYGLIRLQARGMFAPWLAHALTDIVIVAIVYAFVAEVL